MATRFGRHRRLCGWFCAKENRETIHSGHRIVRLGSALPQREWCDKHQLQRVVDHDCQRSELGRRRSLMGCWRNLGSTVYWQLCSRFLAWVQNWLDFAATFLKYSERQ